jgi:membrane protein DedA with SNARE-associated domain
MAVLAWVMMGLALWHFTIFIDDRFWGGIVGAFLGALIGSVVVAFLINGVSIPSQHDTHLLTALDAVPGALLGMAVVYFEGTRRGRPE